MLGMRTWVQAVSIGVALWCGPHLEAFQSAGVAKVAIVPRERPRAAPEAEPLLRIDSSLVLIPVHVTNSIGASVTGLPRDGFHVFEDGVEQMVSSFYTDDAPVSIGFL